MVKNTNEKNGKNASSNKNTMPSMDYVFRELTLDSVYVDSLSIYAMYNSYDSIGCAIAIDSDGISGVTGRFRLGVVKCYLPKWERVFIHMFSPEEGVTEFATLPKALKYVKSCNMNDDEIEVDFSRLCKDRFWLGPADLPKLQWLSDKPVWQRRDQYSTSPRANKTPEDWKQCTECKYLIDDDEPFLSCQKCRNPYHSDCLLKHEKLDPPCFDRKLLDEQAAKYVLANKKWKARKTSKNPSLVLEDVEKKEDDIGVTHESALSLVTSHPSFTCTSCRECRFCDLPINQEIIPSVPNPPSTQPFVVCIKCNSAFHGHCGFPQVPRLHSSVEWQCDDCRECNSCGRITYLNESTGQPSLLTEWALPSFDQCKQCFAGIDKGEYCPVCMKAWTMEWGGDMVQCDLCEFWVHTLCDDLNSVSVTKLGKSDVKYNCPICRDTTDIHRRRRVIDLLRAIDKIALFSEPVSAAFLPVYVKVIKQPMDLSKMRSKNESGYLSNIDFIGDFELIVANAKIFNMPNSPAFRLAEQFHKQGKLLIEKYLLNDKKGASKIEGLEDDDEGEVKLEDEAEAAGRPSRQASMQAVKNWSRTQQNMSKKKSLSYSDVLEIIKKRGDRVSPVLQETDSLMPAGENIISPYRKRRLSGMMQGSPIPTTKPLSGIVTPTIETLPNSSLLTEPELTTALVSILGLKDSWYIVNGFQVLDPRSTVPGTFIPLRAYISETSSCSNESSETVARKFNWCLFESCNVCLGYGEPWDIVCCSECGESSHYYCSGLVVRPDPSSVNPITGKFSKKFTCQTCADAASRCGLCGHSIESCERFKIEVADNMIFEICSDCVYDQTLRVFKSHSCAECLGTIHPAMASALMKIMNPNEVQDMSNSGRFAPTVHCVGCGNLWHARCLKEFSDLTSAEFVGTYLCESCGDSERNFDVKDLLSSTNSFLTGFKSSLYREILLETIVEILSNYGICQSGDKRGVVSAISTSPFVNELLDIFLAASGAPVSVSASGLLQACKTEDNPKLSDKERSWIEWGLVHKDLLVALSSMSSTDLGNKRKLFDASSIDKSSVKFKRMDDEDLLFAKRFDKAGKLFEGIIGDSFMMLDKSLEQNEKMTSPIFPTSLIGGNQAYEKLINSGEKGAALCQAWLQKYGLNGGYMGPSSTVSFEPGKFHPFKNRRIVPEWDTRACALCTHRGDQIVMGSLLPFVGGTTDQVGWIHSECLRWSLTTRDFSIPQTGWVDPIYAIPSVGVPPVVPQRQTIISSYEVSQLVLRATSTDGGVFCGVCDQLGASVYCQQCNTSAYHFACALSVNELDSSSSSIGGFSPNRVVMDSRCSLLTCGKCLYRNSHLDKWFESEFARASFRQTQSIFGQVMTMVRHTRPLVIGIDAVFFGDKVNYRCGSLTIIDRGNFSFHQYDGRRTMVPNGFISVRLFSSMEVPITDEVAVKFGLSEKEDRKLLKRQHRCGYMCKISADGTIYTIQVIGGRTIAVGKSLNECFAEFRVVFEMNRVSKLTISGETFFGLNSACMRDHYNEFANRSVRKHASLCREKWMYHAQLRPAVVSALGLDSELRPVSSFRRNLSSVSNEAANSIDQLRSLGREKFFGSHKTLHDSESPDHELLEPNMVIAEWIGAEDTKPLRNGGPVSSNTGGPSAGFASKYKVRTLIGDSEVLNVQRSKIHNYGLFAKNGFGKGEFVVEYQGEILRETIADEREKRAERAGNGDGGSCYMFRLDEDHVIDATLKGNCARFINHSCNPNCTCRMVEDDNRRKHIMIIAKREIAVGEEITYDYQFAVESEKLACLCGAPNCLGRLN